MQYWSQEFLQQVAELCVASQRDSSLACCPARQRELPQVPIIIWWSLEVDDFSIFVQLVRDYRRCQRLFGVLWFLSIWFSNIAQDGCRWSSKRSLKTFFLTKIHPGHILPICCLFSFYHIREKMLGNEIMVNGRCISLFSCWPKRVSWEIFLC